MTTRARGVYGFTDEAARQKAAQAFTRASGVPAVGVSAAGPLLSLDLSVEEASEEQLGKALVALAGSASGGHVDLIEPGQSWLRYFAGKTSWAWRAAPTTGGERRLGSLAFCFDAPISGLAFHPDGRLAVGGAEHGRGRVAVFDPDGMELIYTWAHEQPGGRYGREDVPVAFSPAGDQLVSGSGDGLAVVRDTTLGRPRFTLEHGEPIDWLAWQDTTLVTGGPKRVKLWSTTSHQALATLSLERSSLAGVGPAGLFVYASIAPRTCTLARIDLSAAKLVDSIPVGDGVLAADGHGGHALAARTSSHKPGKAIALLAAGARKAVSIKLDAPCVALTFTPDRHLVAALATGHVLEFSPTGAEVARYEVRPELPSTTHLWASPSGQTIALGAGATRPVLIDRASKSVQDNRPYASRMVASPVGQTVAVMGDTTRAWLLDLATGTESPLPDGEPLAFSADGALLLQQSEGVYVVRAADSRAEKARFKGQQASFLALAPDASAVAVTVSGDLHLTDVASGKSKRLGARGLHAHSAAFSPDGASLAVGRDAGVELLNLATGKTTAVLATPKFPEAIRFSPDGARVVAAGDGFTTAWSLADRRPVFSLDRRGNMLDWSPDGATIAVANRSSVTTLHPDTGAAQETFYRHQDDLFSVAFSGDGAALLSHAGDGTIVTVPRTPSATTAAAGPITAAGPTAAARPPAATPPGPPQAPVAAVPTTSSATTKLEERAAAAARSKDAQTSRSAQARSEVPLSSSPTRLPIAVAPADAPLSPGPASRLRAHGTLVYLSTKDLREGTRGFDAHAYSEWYTSADLEVDGLTVRVDIEADLEVDCVGFGRSFLELARPAAGGHVDVAWERGLTPRRYEARAWTATVIVPPVPPGATARHGRMARSLGGPLATNRRGEIASATRTSVVSGGEDGTVEKTVAAAAHHIVWFDEQSMVVLVSQASKTEEEGEALVCLDRATGAVLRARDTDDRLTLSSATPDGFFVVRGESGLLLFDRTATLIATLRQKQDQYQDGVSVSPGGALVAFTREGLLCVWEPAAEGTPVRKIKGNFCGVTFLADGTLVALGTTDEAADNPRSWLTRLEPTGAVLLAARAGKSFNEIQPAGDGVVVRSSDGALAHFGPDLKKRWALELPRELLESVPVESHDGATLLGVSKQGGLVRLDLATGERTGDHALAITSVTASAAWLATLDEGGELIVRDRATGVAHLRHLLTLKAEKNAHIAFSPDGRTLAVADSERLIVIDLESRSLRELARDKLTSVAYALDGTRLTGHASGVLRRSRGEQTEEQTIGDDIRRVTVAASGARVAVALKDGTVKVLIEGKKPRVFRTDKGLLGTLALSPDGAHVVLTLSRKVSGRTVSQVLLTAVDDGRQVVLLDRASPVACAFSPDGRRLAVSDRHRVRLFALPEGHETGQIVGHGWPVRALAFAPDGTLYSSSEDATTVAWDLTAIDALGGGHPVEEETDDR